jgi:DNA-binding CsgD family transcriptional regulator
LSEPLDFKTFIRHTQENTTRENQSSLAEVQPALDPYADLTKKWNKMSRRERDVTALTCLGYTNRQIAARLKVSVNTVNTHVVRVLTRLDLNGKPALQVLFASWDFSAWERRSTQR